MELPREFRQRIGEVHGDTGVAWLEELPALLREFKSAWGAQDLQHDAMGDLRGDAGGVPTQDTQT